MEEATSPQTLPIANHSPDTPNTPYQQQSKPGPQLWAVLLASAGLYYLWTRLLPKKSGDGRRLGSKRPSDAEMAAARERQQLRLARAAASEEKEGRERSAPAPASESSRRRQPEPDREKQREAEEKKRKQRQLYLRKKAEMEKREEERRKDEELGPGWRYRQDPSVVRNVVDGMNPQSGGDGGGYKPQVCTRRGG